MPMPMTVLVVMTGMVPQGLCEDNSCCSDDGQVDDCCGAAARDEIGDEYVGDNGVDVYDDGGKEWWLFLC